MPFNLLLLPLLGGFLLLHRSYRWRFLLARFDGHRLIFFSAFAGVFLLAVSTVLTYLLAYLWPFLADSWHDVVPFAHSGKAIGALALGFSLPCVINRRRGQDRATQTRATIEYFGDDLEMLILRSMDVRMPLLITLGTGKVYVGYAARLFNPEVDRKYLRLMPVASGFRTRESHQVRFTTDYSAVMEASDDPTSEFHGLLRKDFELVISVEDIRSASLFDFAAYDAFTKASEGTDDE